MSGSTSQPNLNSIVAALQHTPRDTGLDLAALNEFSDYWEKVREYYHPFDTAPKTGSAEVYLHEMPGGQYTNLKEQAASMGVAIRWPEIARLYAEVNQLFGDIVKVTPCSKVVGDMALFLFSRGIKPADVVNLEPGSRPFPRVRRRHVERRPRLAGWRLAERFAAHRAGREARRRSATGTSKRGVVPVTTPANLKKIREGTLRNAQAPSHRRRSLFAPDVSAGVRRFREASTATSATSACCPRRRSSTVSSTARKSR